jgi:hypothetical protein
MRPQQQERPRQEDRYIQRTAAIEEVGPGRRRPGRGPQPAAVGVNPQPEGYANAFMQLAGTRGVGHRAGLVDARRLGGPLPTWRLAGRSPRRLGPRPPAPPTRPGGKQQRHGRPPNARCRRTMLGSLVHPSILRFAYVPGGPGSVSPPPSRHVHPSTMNTTRTSQPDTGTTGQRNPGALTTRTMARLAATSRPHRQGKAEHGRAGAGTRTRNLLFRRCERTVQCVPIHALLAGQVWC